MKNQLLMVGVGCAIFLITAIATGFGRKIGSGYAKNLFPSFSSDTTNGGVGIQRKSKVFVLGKDIEVAIDQSGNPNIQKKSEEVRDEEILNLIKEKKLIVEGKCDKDILKVALDYLCEFGNTDMYPCDVNIIEAHGASRVVEIVDWGSKADSEFCVLLDNDLGAHSAKEQLARKIDMDRVLTVEYTDPDAVDLVDLLPTQISHENTHPTKLGEKLKNELEQGNIAESDLERLKRLLWKINEVLDTS